jgi:hypothetical protein
MEWMARVFDLSDDGLSVKTCYGATQYGAESNAREWIGEQSVKQPGRTFYVFDDGTDAPEPETHSVKA